MAQDSIERAKGLIAFRDVIFFEVWVDPDEEIHHVADGLAKLKCATSVDAHRRVIRTFAPNRLPQKLAGKL